ncbi:MAG TPA: hypothetical protein VKM94_17220 [Blastocatellia bacterium]|nr:hypothetical protein [Blastocatellia bacterium]
MRKLALFLAALGLALPVLAQSHSPTCLRIMSLDEIVRSSILIGRVKVKKVERARFRGEFGQLATLTPVDVIDGDFTLTEINVLAGSAVRCAEDYYERDHEMLVFLEPESSLFHTVNYQFGAFMIVGNLVKNWREKDKICDKPYAEVKEQILQSLVVVRRAPSRSQSVPPQKPPEGGLPPRPPEG